MQPPETGVMRTAGSPISIGIGMGMGMGAVYTGMYMWPPKMAVMQRVVIQLVVMRPPKMAVMQEVVMQCPIYL